MEAVKLTIMCFSPHDCMKMTEKARDRILSSGPARFQRLSAFHPSITARPPTVLSTKLSTSFPRALFNVILKLEVVSAHIGNSFITDHIILHKTRELVSFCRSLSNIYQVIFYIFKKDIFYVFYFYQFYNFIKLLFLAI